MNSINILGIEYKIKMFDSNSRSDCAMGRSDSKNGTIHINNELPEDIKDLTLLHESIHIISDMLNLELNEQQVSSLSTALFILLNRNFKINVNNK